MHFIIFSFALKLPPIAPYINTLSLNIICLKFTIKITTISSFKFAFTLFFAFYVIAIIGCAIIPGFDAVAVLFIVLSFSGIFCSIYMGVYSIAVSFIIFSYRKNNKVYKKKKIMFKI